jgi:hypothetical protein
MTRPFDSSRCLLKLLPTNEIQAVEKAIPATIMPDFLHPSWKPIALVMTPLQGTFLRKTVLNHSLIQTARTI